MRIEIMAGSGRRVSLTKRVAIHLLKGLNQYDDLSVGMVDLSEIEIPIMNGAFTRPADAPPHLREIAERMFSADAFILVSPEYNGSFSPVLKNFLDHFPRQSRKVFGIVTGSTGGFGGIRAAIQLQNLTYGLMGIGSPQMLIVPQMDKKFDEHGALIDLGFRLEIRAFISSFLWLGRAITRSNKMDLTKAAQEDTVVAGPYYH